MNARTLKRRHDVLTLRDAVNYGSWLRSNRLRSFRLSWQMRQKWKDAPRCTVLREPQPAI